MPAKTLTFYLITMLLAISAVVYAGNPKECTASKISKTYCKTIATLCKLKTCKTHISHKPLQKMQEKSNPAGSVSPSPANTFETIIAPFIKTIAPHFYEQILKKEETKLPEAMKSRAA
jgi:hypothetical protein